MDDLDDMFDSIINKPTKPQPKKAEASSLESKEKKNEVTKIEKTEDEAPPLQYRRIKKDLIDNDESAEIIATPCVKCGDTETPLHVNKVCGNCYTPEAVQTKDREDPLQYRRIKKVPYLKRWPKCGLCSTVLLGNRFGWFAEDEDGKHWWWCVPCMEKCNCYVTKEEIKRAKQER